MPTGENRTRRRTRPPPTRRSARYVSMSDRRRGDKSLASTRLRVGESAYHRCVLGPRHLRSWFASVPWLRRCPSLRGLSWLQDASGRSCAGEG
ncbi:hypothetical protein MRX96_054388 [Rhipicephalus microplus]